VAWKDGTRVIVASHPSWPDGATGTVRPFPTVVADLCDQSDGCSRVVQGRQGPLTFFWVVFDAPVRDGDGDGPYQEGEIRSEYLSPN
jgi:hypothetical protein